MSSCPFSVIDHRGISQFELRARRADAIRRILGLCASAGAFVATWIFFTCFIIFVGNLPRRTDPWIASVDGASTLWEAPIWSSMVVNLLLIALFGLQHSGMARSACKAWLHRHIPPALERTIYVYAACAAGFLLVLLWQPIPIVVWNIEGDALRTLVWAGFVSGWLMLLAAALSIDILDLLGLKQSWTFYARRPPAALTLKTGALYRWLEHPMYVGVLLGIWCAPHMTVGHLLLASGLTAYIAIGMVFEERDLERKFGAAYETWKRPSLLSPLPAAAQRWWWSRSNARLWRSGLIE